MLRNSLLSDSNPLSELNSLLSASSYPSQDSHSVQPTSEGYEQTLLSGAHGILSPGTKNSEPGRDQDSQSDPSEQSKQKREQNPPHSDRLSGKRSARKKRGRPRKNDESHTDELPADRRRGQIRLAQRAYRARQEAVLSEYEARIAQLESGMKKMNAAINSLGQHLGETGIMATHPDLYFRIHNALETCSNVSEEVGLTTDRNQACSSTPDEGSNLSVLLEKQGHEPSPSSPASLSSSHGQMAVTFPNPSPWPMIGDSSTPSGSDSPLLFDAPSTSVVDLAHFIRQLRLACAYHAYISLRSSSVRLEDLRGKFRFLLSILTREELTSYFEASIQARIYPERMTKWQSLPFFAVGGAGTHYLSSSPSISVSRNASRGYQNQTPIRENALSEFPPEVQEEMDGKWYDIRDLEGFLQEKGVHFVGGTPTESRRGVEMQTAANPSHLIKALVGMCICLGRSPGWRPLDVEKALRMALWT